MLQSHLLPTVQISIFQLKHCHIFLQSDSKSDESWTLIPFRQVNTDQHLKIKRQMWIVLRLGGCCVINKTFGEALRWTAACISDNKQDTLLLSCVSKRLYPGLASTALTLNGQGGITCPPSWRWAFLLTARSCVCVRVWSCAVYTVVFSNRAWLLSFLCT